MTWRDRFEPIIAAVLREHPTDTPERRKALRAAYPAGERKYWPYKVWLDAIARMTGRRPPLYTKKTKPIEGQGRLFQ